MPKKIKDIFNKLKIFLKEKIDQEHKNSRWFELMELLASAVTLRTYCEISPVLAEYQGRTTLYWTAAIVSVLLLLIAVWEIICLVGCDGWSKLYKIIHNLIQKAADFISGRVHVLRFIYVIPLLVIIGTAAGITIWQFHTTACYASVTEIYGIPTGVGEPLSSKERKVCAAYWKIEDYSFRRTLIVTHEDTYHEEEIMREYSSIYSMTFFQPVDRMVYQYQKNKKKFKNLDDEKAFMSSYDNKFREPVKISYFNSKGKLILQLQKEDGKDIFDVLTYSLDSAPQLFRSTLLQIPENEDMEENTELDERIERNALATSIMSQKIEVTYNADGLPDTRRISPRIYNQYGVNGERYIYNQNKQLTALYYLDANGNPICNQAGIMSVFFEHDEKDRLTGVRYYSDENGEEKIEGFHGVFCEKYEYDEDGNLCVRKQLNQSENRWYDKNGVCEYRYTYVDGRLKRESFLDFSGNDITNQKVKSTYVEFVKDQDNVGNKVLTVTLDSDIRLADQDDPLPVRETEKDQEQQTEKQKKEQEAIPASSRKISSEKAEAGSVKNQQNPQSKEPITSVDADEDTENEKKDSVASDEKAEGRSFAAEQQNSKGQAATSEENRPSRNYSTVCYTYKKKDKALQISYKYDGALVQNEQGYCVKVLSYDDRSRTVKKTYLDEMEKPCLTLDGYARVHFEYMSGDGDRKKRIEYKDDMEEEKLAINRRFGYAYVEYQSHEKEKNPNGDTAVTLEYYDQNEKLICLPEKGYAKIRKTYNNRGLLIRERYYNVLEDKEKQVYRTDFMVAGIDYEYADDGNLISVIYKDEADQMINRMDTGFAVKLQEFKNGKLMRIHYQGYKDNVLQDVVYKKEGIGSIRYVYANGRQVEEHYFDLNGNPALRSDIGCAVLKTEYNERGLAAAYYYCGTDGKLILRRDTGYAIVRYQYDKLGRKILEHYYDTDQKPIISTKYYCAGMQYHYDAKGNRDEICYLDGNSNLMNRSDLGYARIKRVYNTDAKLTEERYFDREGKPAVCKDGGYAVYSAKYEGGNLCKVEYKDGEDNLVRHTERGFASVTYKYDDQDRCVLENYFDLNREKKEIISVISKKYQCAGFQYRYDDKENWKIIGYLNTDGKPMIRRDLGYAYVCKQYDDANRLVSEIYYDKEVDWKETDPEKIEQHKILCKDGGYASFENTYDKNGNCVRVIYKDKEGRLTLRKDNGYSVVRKEYDDLGRCVQVSYYGKDFDLAADDKQMAEHEEADRKSDANQAALTYNAEYGIAGFLYHYDEDGNTTDIIYTDADKNVIMRRDLGYARIHREYDEQGNLISENYYDANDEPAVSKDGGYASFKKKYQNDKCIEVVYYDTVGKPVLRNKEGFAVEKWQYDALGQCISDAYYDTQGKPVIHREYLCAAFEYGYDSRGNCIDIRYRGKDGKIMIRPDLGYAHEKSEYDDRGNREKVSYYDDEDRLTLAKKSGIAYMEEAFDENGNCVERRCYGKKRELKVRKDAGYALSRYDYNAYGQCTKSQYYGTDEKTPILSAKYHCAGFRYEYDEMGNDSATEYIGLDGTIMIREDLGYARREMTMEYDSEANRTTERTRFLDCSGRPAAKKEGGYTGYAESYVCGKRVEIRYYMGESCEDCYLTEREDKGYAIKKMKYDSFGQLISESYYDADDQQVCFLGDADKSGNRPEIYATIVYVYDEKGNCVQEEYEDSSCDKMVRGDYGYAQLFRVYDEQGNTVETRYYDTDHKPMERPGGYFSIDWCYSSGNCTEERYYDKEKRLMLIRDENCAIQKKLYDEYGQCMLISYYGTEGESVINKRYDCAAFEYRYDRLGNKTDIIYRDTNGDLKVREGLGYAWVKQKYDEWNRLEVETYYDAEQNPTTDGKGYAGLRYQYNEMGEEHIIPIDLNGNDIAPVTNEEEAYE